MRLPLALMLLAGPLAAATHSVTVAGLGGEPDYEQRFTAWAQEIAKLTKSEVLDGPAASRERIRAVFEKLARELTPQDNLAVVLIGHGTFDGVEYKFNVPGPDLTAAELAALLDR